jgi:hypothetical protein
MTSVAYRQPRSSILFILFVAVVILSTADSACLVVSQRAAREASVLADLRAVLDAEKVLYATEHLYGRLEELDSKGIIDAGLVKDHNRHYRHLGVKLKGSAFEVFATPIRYQRDSKMSFFADASGQIRCADKRGADADASDGICD